jgi:hypothetical protein
LQPLGWRGIVRRQCVALIVVLDEEKQQAH